MRRFPTGLAPLVLAVVGSACATSGPRGGDHDEAHPTAVVVPTFTVAPPPPPGPPPAPPTVPGLEPAANPACTLSSTGELARAIPLRVEDSAPFFHVVEANALEVRLASPRSTVSASRSDVEIRGHVRLSDVPVRLRSGALVDGYLRVHHATLRDGDPARLELVVDPPWFLRPVEAPVVAVTCDEIVLARATGRTEPLFRGKQVDLRRGTPIGVRAMPNGPVLATITVPRAEPGFAQPIVDAHETERRGAEVRVLIEWDQVDVEGWVSRRDVSPHVDSPMEMLMTSRLGEGSKIALTSEAPLLVRTSGRVVRVGTAKPGNFACLEPADASAREIELGSSPFFGGLGLGGPGAGAQPAKAKLFVVPTRGETCGGLGASDRK